MNEKLTLKARLIFTGIVTLLIWTHLVWDHFNGGVPTHHIMQSEDLPGISNWWGGIALPILSWIILYRIKQRVNDNTLSRGTHSLPNIVYRFVAALVFGIALSFFFTLGTNVTDYMMIGLFTLSFLIPIYRGEYLLGFVIGTAYTLGAIIPIVFGVILMIIFAVTYKFVRAGVLYLVSKIKLNRFKSN